MLEYQPQKAFGAKLVDGGVHFRLWAPSQEEVGCPGQLWPIADVQVG
jgi:1,4-alpha-glucan branching enzyme